MMKNRRNFLKTLAALTASTMVPYKDLFGNTVLHRDRFGELLPLRHLGKTGEKVTMLGLGGAHVARVEESMSQALVERAMEGGIRFFDTAHGYGDGLSEERYGRYLVPRYRDSVFIMTESPARSGDLALEHLELSLKRMKADYVDLWQIHAIGGPEDANNRINQEVLEVFRKAKESGKARFIGLTGHQDFNGLQHMLEQTDILETIQMPINCFDPNYKSYINNVMPTALEQNMGVIAMKTLSNGGFFGGTEHYEGGDNPKVIPDVVSVREAMHFVWSLPVSVALTGPNNVDMLQEKIDLATSFTEMDEKQREELVARVGSAGLDGSKVEFYKA